MESVNIVASVSSKPKTNKTLILVICSVMCFFLAFTCAGINIALPAIGNEFKANAILLNWVVTLALLVMGVFLVPAGRLADIIGTKKVFMIGLIIFIPVSTLTAFSNSIYMLLVCQVIQGIGLAMVFATSTAMITTVYPTNERGRALGINVGVLYFGTSIAPFICGFLTEHIGWRSIFLIAVPCGIVMLILLLLYVKEDWVHSRGEKFDYIGAIIFGLSLVSLMYGFSVMPQVYGFALILIGIAGTIIFFKWESRTKSPVFDTSIFRDNRVFQFSNITAFISYSAVAAVSYLLSLYLQYNKGLSAEVAGLVLIAQPIMQALFSPFTGRFSDRVEPRILASLGMGLTCLGLIPFAFVTADTSIFLIVGALIVLGVGFGLFSSPNTNAVMSSISAKHYGVASATLGTMRSLGQLFSMGITMILISAIVGRVVITPEHYATFLTCVRVAFAIFSVLCLIGVFTSLARGKLR